MLKSLQCQALAHEDQVDECAQTNGMVINAKALKIPQAQI